MPTVQMPSPLGLDPLGKASLGRPAGPFVPPVVPPFDVLPSLPPFALGQHNDVRTEMLLGSLGWTDISKYVEEITDQQDSRGKPDESTSNTPGNLTLVLKNPDGRFFDGNPNSPYYGNLGRNTQLRISVPEGASYLRMRDDLTSYCATLSSSALNPPGDIDVQIDLTLDNWRSAQQLCGKWGGGLATQSWALLISQTGTLTFNASTTGTNTLTSASAVPVAVPPGRRQLIRATRASSTGQVLFYTGTGSLSSPTWTLIDTVPGTAGALFGGNNSVLVGNAENGGFVVGTAITGKIHAFQLLSGINGTVVASPDFTVQTPGAASFNDAQGNTWTPAGTAIISNRHYRFWGETSAFPTAWNARGNSVNISLQAAGILRRLTQSASQQVFQSALRRAWPKLPDLVAYWPCEDGNSQGFGFATAVAPTSFASASPHTPIGTYQGGPPQFASDNNFAASAALPTLNGATWQFPIPQNHPADVGNICRFLLDVPQAGEPATFVGGATQDVALFDIHTTGTVAKLSLCLQGGSQPIANGPISTNLVAFAFNSAGTQIGSGSTAVPVQGIPCWVSLEMYQSGGNVQIAIGIQILGPLGSVATYTGFTVTGTLGNGTQIVVDAAGTLIQTALGQITYQRAFHDMSLGEYTLQVNAWTGETAGNRFQRLCSEQGIPFQARGNLADTQPMGVQSTIDVMSLLQECVDADRGMWWEPPWQLALGYRTLADLLNQQPVASIPYAGSSAQAGGLTSNEDDQFTVNDAIVVNTYTGGQAEVAVTSGPLSTQAPPSGVGPYEAQPQINLANDYQCADSAGWITWVGTAPDLRYPAIPFPMSRQSRATFFALQEMDVGDRLQIVTPPANGAPPANTAQPSWLPPSSQTSYARGGIDVLVNNLATTLNVKRYDITVTGVPTTPYLCAQADDPVHGHLGAANSQLAGPVTATQTTLPVQTPVNSINRPTDPWTTNGLDFPFDLGVGGEQITATACGGAAVNDVGSDSANPPQIAVTPGATSSVIYGCVLNPTNSTAFTANGSTTFSQNVSDATNSRAYGTFRSTGTTTAGTPVTVGASAPAVSAHIEAAEVVANGGAVTEDASSPAGVSTTSAMTLTTASFTPPANSMLLAMVVANGSGPGQAISDTLGGSWQLLANDGADNVTIWCRYIGPSPAAMTVTSTWSGGGASNGGALTVKVLTSAAAGLGCQVFTVIRSQNGIAKAQAAGTPVDLYTIPALSL